MTNIQTLKSEKEKVMKGCNRLTYGKLGLEYYCGSITLCPTCQAELSALNLGIQACENQIKEFEVIINKLCYCSLKDNTKHNQLRCCLCLTKDRFRLELSQLLSQSQHKQEETTLRKKNMQMSTLPTSSEPCSNNELCSPDKTDCIQQKGCGQVIEWKKGFFCKCGDEVVGRNLIIDKYETTLCKSCKAKEVQKKCKHKYPIFKVVR